MKIEYAFSNFKDADVVILGIPLDRTSSFIPGSRFGPRFIRQCAENIEVFSPYQNKSVLDLKICDLEDIQFSSGNGILEIEREVNKILDTDKFFVFLGGEHTITFPILKAFRKRYRKFSVVHFDAHADLRDKFDGEKICHATALRRASEVVGIENIYQFGIRSGTKEEFKFHKGIYPFRVYESLHKVINKIKGPIYVTIDVDVLDAGVLPAVSTPEPGGISFRELIDALLLFRNKKIIGADIVEYNPLSAPPYASGSTVAEILRELILVSS